MISMCTLGKIFWRIAYVTGRFPTPVCTLGKKLIRIAYIAIYTTKWIISFLKMG